MSGRQGSSKELTASATMLTMIRGWFEDRILMAVKVKKLDEQDHTHPLTVAQCRTVLQCLPRFESPLAKLQPTHEPPVDLSARLAECEAALHHYSGGASEYFLRHERSAQPPAELIELRDYLANELRDTRGVHQGYVDLAEKVHDKLVRIIASGASPPPGALQRYCIHGILTPISENGVMHTSLTEWRKATTHDVYLCSDVDSGPTKPAALTPLEQASVDMSSGARESFTDAIYSGSGEDVAP